MGKKFLLLALATATLVMAGCKNVSSDDLDLDTAALTAVVSDATALLDSTTVGTAVGNVSQADKDAYSAAITAAQALISSGAASQAEIDAAKTALDQATTAFKAAIVVASPADKTTLAKATSDASILLDATAVGTAAGNVSQADKDAYAAAITAAQAVISNGMATQAEVDAAITTLAQGTTAFRDSYIGKIDLKFTYGFVHDCTRDLSDLSVFSATRFGLPYDLLGHAWMTEFLQDNGYSIVVDIKTAADGDTITSASLVLYNEDGSLNRVLCSSGQIFCLGKEGFMYMADGADLRYFFSPTALDFEDEVTYAYTVPMVTRKSELVW